MKEQDLEVEKTENLANPEPIRPCGRFYNTSGNQPCNSENNPNSKLKSLSQRVGYEVWIRPRYAIARFMRSKVAFKTQDNQPMLCTIKPITEKGVGDQIQIHLRFEGKDLWNKLSDTLDVDVYIPLDQWKKVVRLVE